LKSRGIIIAWILGEAIVIYRGAFKEKRPPWPSELLLSSLVFVGLGFISEIEALATPAVLLAFGWDIAAFMNVAPSLPVNKPRPGGGHVTPDATA
jgi:hypothetical protein